MTKTVKALPEGFHSITPSLIVKDGVKAIEFYKKAFGAEEIKRAMGPDGKGVLHAHLKIGDSAFFLTEENSKQRTQSPETLHAVTATFYLYMNDVDTAFKQAVAAGAKEEMPVMEMFWGDRTGSVVDPFGHKWVIATHTRDMTYQEIEKEKEAFFAQMSSTKPM
ncbi:MAG TPA: VOC family protein [Chlamydiales bacterium]|nr:VOC family protein [Chlamydiales bacterium]